MTKTFAWIILLLPRIVFAQYLVSGKVLSSNNAPIANANVFLNHATIGGKTGDDGTFTLRAVKPGTYQLVVSMVGFNSFETFITITNGDLNLPNIYIEKKVIALNEVKITLSDDAQRENDLELFRQVFLGTSERAKECKLINPEVLDFDYDKKSKVLTAKSGDLLVIENRALGYRVKYLLSNFLYDQAHGKFLYGGSVLFDELKGNPSEQRRWNEQRQGVYENSLQHFLRAAAANELKEEGFTVFRLETNPDRPPDSLINKKIALFTLLKDKRLYRDSLSFWLKKSQIPKFVTNAQPTVLSGEDIVQSTGKNNLYALGCEKDALFVVYDEGKLARFASGSLKRLSDQDNKSATLLRFNAPAALMTTDGALINPESLSFAGVWANKRIAELLPDNYEPPETEPVDKGLFEKLDSLSKSYSAGHPVEIAYLHLDKSAYSAGDTIYLKAYVTSQSNQPAELSKILNVELIGPARRIDQAIKLRLSDGMAAGDIALPDSLTTGYYRIRAYTSLMLRQGTDGLYEKYIPLAGSPSATKIAEHSNAAALHQKPRAAGKKSTHPKVDLQFFAEGGNLVTGAPCAVAFKAIGPDGLGVSVKGIIKDEQGHKVADFTSSHRGMGVISLVPGPGTRYKAYLIYPDSLDSGIELPKASDSGFRLNIVTTDPRYLTINVSAGAQNHQSTINVVAQSGGKVYYSTTDRIIGGKFSTTVPKDRFPEGIVQFTLFTAKGELMNERLVFIRNLNEIRFKILDADSVSGPRQKMKINIAAVDGSYQPVSGSFSISVVDETHSPVSDRNSDNILSRLLLASGLHGYIEDPGYYFSADNETVNGNLDLLMLTQGYSRFEWKQILTHTLTAPVVQPEKIHMVTGSIKTLGGKPVPHAKVSMFSVSKAYFAMDTVADDNGHFIFADFPTDSMHYVIQAADKELRLKTTVTIDGGTPPRLIDNAFTENGGAGNDTALIAYAKFDQHFHDEQLRLGFGKHTTLLKGVVIRGRAATKKYLENSSNLNGPGEANEVITADQIPPGAPTFKDAIIGHLHGIQYLGGNFYYGSASTLVVLDGMEIQGNLTFKNMQPTIDSEHKGSQSQSDVLNTIPISSIASVEIITDASLAGPYGMRGAGGVIIITTKKWADVLPDKKNIIVHYADYAPPVFYKARVFYSPQYDPDKRRISAADWRTTIFWAPNISTDENGNATIAFYNADSQGSYEVTIEGMDNNGRLGRLVYHYRVK